MITIIGLGNPGEKFKNTRHNSGFMTIDFFARENGFPDFEFSKKYNSLISEKDDLLLMKPQTFMNNSGAPVKKILNLKSKILNLIVVHDDIDLPLGTIKLSKGSGAGGHKGVESIINSLGTKDFIRLRIGICPKNGKSKNVESFVIKKFTKEERKIIDKTIEKSSKAISYLIENGLEKAMNQFN